MWQPRTGLFLTSLQLNLLILDERRCLGVGILCLMSFIWSFQVDIHRNVYGGTNGVESVLILIYGNVSVGKNAYYQAIIFSSCLVFNSNKDGHCEAKEISSGQHSRQSYCQRKTLCQGTRRMTPDDIRSHNIHFIQIISSQVMSHQVNQEHQTNVQTPFNFLDY